MAIVIVNGKVCDLSKVFPLTPAEVLALRKMGITAEKPLESAAQVARFALFLLQKGNPEITVADFDTLTLRQLDQIRETLKEYHP